jgi:mannose-6-phosphate isomerase-like protein (cupin superfamily)
MHKNMREMEQYSDDQFVVKGVYKGEQSEAVLLFLLPGQEMPSHPHERFEVVLTPHKGKGLMIVDDTKEVELLPETLYYESAGHSFRIKNTGDDPLQVLITLIRVEPAVSPLQASSSAEGQVEHRRAEDRLGLSPL